MSRYFGARSKVPQGEGNLQAWIKGARQWVVFLVRAGLSLSTTSSNMSVGILMKFWKAWIFIRSPHETIITGHAQVSWVIQLRTPYAPGRPSSSAVSSSSINDYDGHGNIPGTVSRLELAKCNFWPQA
ncbi:hypothetical protein GWK47_050108 [Chionoecetes opilio]|uniref:Uncharacterized protein n=1 Tax=Chionoecetes opilio TaxID=41210 RepID=A0A8J5CEL1_CHIOP|nr:hypothetical protein GWK47_050108 [Chionoecetes opilio]